MTNPEVNIFIDDTIIFFLEEALDRMNKINISRIAIGQMPYIESDYILYVLQMYKYGAVDPNLAKRVEEK